MFVKCENSRSSNHTEALIDYFTENHCHDHHNATRPIGLTGSTSSSQVLLLSHLAGRDQRFQCGFLFL